MKLTSPFRPLDAQDSSLSALPPSLEPLRARMAEVYGLPAHNIVVTRGASHRFELALRRMKFMGYDTIISDHDAYIVDLCEIYNLEIKAPPTRGPIGKTSGLYRIENPRQPDGRCWDIVAARSIAVEIFPAWLVIDESLFDACDGPSLTALIESESNVIILKSLSYLYGLSGARVGALLGAAKTVQSLLRYIEPHPLPTGSIRAAERALSPSRQIAVIERIGQLRKAQAVLKARLPEAQGLEGFSVETAPFCLLRPKNLLATQTALKRFGISAQNHEAGLLVGIGVMEDVQRLLAALGVYVERKPSRVAETLRDTKETRIYAKIDLDQPGPLSVATGIGFFDHMLEQVATHGGFSLMLTCEGDLHIDGHHTIEDVMLALGQCLKTALGDKIGLARFGFALPMDETEAEVKIDLGGRPYSVFEGQFDQAMIGDFPTQMTAHAFRSLSETLMASVHVRVKGVNDHHKVEACFKALGRALRMAIKIEGDSLPSTKGVLV